MRLISSIKHQVLMMFMGVTLLLSLVYFAMAIFAAFFVEDTMIYRLLKMEASYIERVYQQTGELPESRLDFVTIYPSSASLPEFIRQGIERGSEDNEIFTPENDHYHYQRVNISESQSDQDDSAFLIAEVSPLLIVTTSPNIVGLFVIAFILALLISVYLAFKMAARTVKPVLEMTDAVQRSQPLPALKYELGYLCQALEDAFERLESSLQRERDFTTDVNHELRTPLTILSNTIALAEQRGVQPDDLDSLKTVSTQMHHTVAVLLALARAESLEKCACDLRGHIEQVALQCVEANGSEFDLQLDMAEEVIVNANPGLVDLLITNLVNNAISHASHPQLIIRYDNNTLTFQNATDIDTLENVAQAGVKSASSQGIGQGLYLVTRILESLGWQYHINLNNQLFVIQISL